MINTTHSGVQRVSHALTEAVTFLIGQQQLDGSWNDFALDVGPSTSWVTAFVLLCLKRSSIVPHPALGPSLERGAAFLLDSRRSSGGWGYNEDVAPDADSTAHSIIALRALSTQVPMESYRFLADHEVVPGLFRTFIDRIPGHAWGVPLLEISAPAILALNDQSRARAYFHHVRQELATRGRLASFWWDSWSYVPYVSAWLACSLNLQNIAYPGFERLINTHCEKETLFGETLRGTALAMNRDIMGLHPIVQDILRSQSVLGSWEGSALMRYANPLTLNSWLRNSAVAGERVSDVQGIFTTAAIVRLLSLYLKLNERQV